MTDMGDSREARNIFQLMKDQIQQDYKNAYEELDRRQKNAEAVLIVYVEDIITLRHRLEENSLLTV